MNIDQEIFALRARKTVALGKARDESASVLQCTYVLGCWPFLALFHIKAHWSLSGAVSQAFWAPLSSFEIRCEVPHQAGL